MLLVLYRLSALAKHVHVSSRVEKGVRWEDLRTHFLKPSLSDLPATPQGMSSLDATQYPTRPACFGQPGFTNATCTVPTESMIDFLNITTVALYKAAYCDNPPQDSCAFGYCPNPDIASPAVRIASTSFSAHVS